jgi:hypothetical protein
VRKNDTLKDERSLIDPAAIRSGQHTVWWSWPCAHSCFTRPGNHGFGFIRSGFRVRAAWSHMVGTL